jgi:hypothetical protein
LKLENEQELRYAYEDISRMYRLIEMIEKDTTGQPETRADQIEGVHAMIRKIERQVADYYSEHPERLQAPQKVA